MDGPGQRGGAAGRVDGVEHLDRVADGDLRARVVRDQVDPEPHLAVEPPVPGQGRHRLAALGRRLRVDGGEHAAGAALRHPELRDADPDAPPAVLGPRGCALDDGVRPEPGHRQRCLRRVPALGDQCVQRVERGGGGEQQRVAVGEGDTVVVVGEVRVGTAPGRVVEVEQPHRGAEQVREPGVGLGAGRDARGVPAVHTGGERLAVGHRDGQRRHPRPGQAEPVGGGGGCDEHEPGMGARGDHGAVVADEHPTPVPGETGPFDDGARHLGTPAGLHRVAPQPGQTHHPEKNSPD